MNHYFSPELEAVDVLCAERFCAQIFIILCEPKYKLLCWKSDTPADDIEKFLNSCSCTTSIVKAAANPYSNDLMYTLNRTGFVKNPLHTRTLDINHTSLSNIIHTYTQADTPRYTRAHATHFHTVQP